MPVSASACELRATGRSQPPTPSPPRDVHRQLLLLFAGLSLEMMKWDFQAGQMFRHDWLQVLSMLLTPKMYFSLSKTLSSSLYQACFCTHGEDNSI